MQLKLFIAAAAIATLASCGTPYQATDTNGVVVATSTQTAFGSQYPNATNVVWTNYDASAEIPIDWELAGWSTMDSGDYLVRFDMDGENYYAWYDSDGNWIGTTYAVRDYTTLPSAVSATVSSQYPAYTISKVQREFMKDRMAYELILKKDDSKMKVLIDGQGNVIKSKNK